MSNAAADAYPSQDVLDSVAIIGMACRFPGANSTEQYWRNLRDGVESISPVSIQDMLDAGVEAAAAHDPLRVAAASTIADVEYFDAAFFDFSPRQAEITDPQHRLFLECAWETLESAGYDPATCGRAIGVFAGCSMSTYLLSNLYPTINASGLSSNLQVLIGNDKDYLATRVAYQLNLKGPAVGVQTACSTCLVAVHLACQSLLNHECDMALAGGVTIRLPAKSGYVYEAGSILSPDGHCKPFDAAAQGTVFGNGIGAVLLKRLTDALADGDVIDAVIKGSAINNDGSLKIGFTAPSEDGQAEVVAEALAMAAAEPHTIQYVEMHGTGTPLGDPIEVFALSRAFRAQAGTHSLPAGTCAIGAVKSNFGHLESAAGIAGLIKTVLALKHRQVPPTLHFTQPNPGIDFSKTPFYVNTQLSAWEAGDTPRRACVSSFGIGGTNAHVVLEEAPTMEDADAAPREPDSDRPHVLPLSARDPAALAALADAYRDFLADEGSGASVPLRDICWSASLRRQHHRQRLAVVGRTRGELVAQLASLSQDPADAPAAGRRRRVVFVFSGQGSQWIGMGRQLLEGEPVFRAALEQCDQVMHRYTGWSLVTELTRRDGDLSWFEHTESVQLALFAIQVGLAALWRSLGVEPDAVVGHSMGEIAAAHVAGVLSLEDSVRVLYHRNRLIQRALGQGKMMAVGLTPDAARELLAGQEARVSIASINSPRSTVLSGDPAILAEIAAKMQSQSTFHRWVDVDFASHSPQMDPLLADLRQELRDISPRKAAIAVASTVTGKENDGTDMDASYWARNLRDPVLFADATRWLLENDYELFVELSPHPILLPSIEESLYHLNRPGIVIPSLRRDADEQGSLLAALGGLYRAGQPIGWDRLYPQSGQYVRLPAYPWQRQRYWVDPPRHARAGLADDAPASHPLLGRRLRSALKDVQFESKVSLATTSYLNDHRVCGRAVFPATAYLEMLWQAAAAWNHSPHVVTDVALHELLSFANEEEHLLQTILTPTGDGEGGLQLLSWEEDAATWRLHVTARVRATRADDDRMPADLSSLLARCPAEIAPAAYYERLREEGLQYGPRFRAIESLRLGQGEVVGQVRLPEMLTMEAATYAMHPALLDACLQLMGAALVEDGAEAPGLSTERKASEPYLYLPVGIASFHIAVPAQGLVSAHVLVRDKTDHETRTADIRLYDEQGQLVAKVLGLRVKRTSRAVLRRRFQDNLSDCFYELQWRRKPRAETAQTGPGLRKNAGGLGRWLILADRDGVGQALAEQIEARGGAAALVFPGARYEHDAARATFHIDPSAPEDFAKVLSADGAPYSAVIYLWGLDATPLELTDTASLARDEPLICGGGLHLAQALARADRSSNSRLCLVTRRAQALESPASAPEAAQAPLWGFGRALAVEHPDLLCMLIDLDTGGVEDNARTLLMEMGAGDDEDQVAYRNAERFVARLVHSSPRLHPGGARIPSAPRQSLQLTTPSRGTLDQLAFEAADRRAPDASEVEIRVRATGLNLRDVLNALGTYPGDPGPLGLECAGEVAAVGEAVDEFRVGDEVVALAQGCFSTFATIPAVLAARKPECLGFAEAATIPISFMTAYYGLCHLARISAGDKVLIHGAAGGLGLAATQLALRANAEVFGTAGSDAKRDYLRALGVQHVMHSRTLDFATEVMELTGGRGVDIVLNSLAGEFIPRSLSVLAQGGRFIEVGKTGIWDADRVTQARPDASYFVLDLGQEMQQDPASTGDMLRYLTGEFEKGTLSPLPRHLFPLQDVIGAFRFMAQAKHLGKIVVTQEAGLSSIAPSRFREDASYLITGGLGALGLRVASWMAEQGARHLALVGRSGASAEAQTALDELARGDVQVRVIEADVSQPGQLARALETIGSSMPPLRGIIHAAGVLDDGILLQQDWKRFAQVLAPKVQGAWNLHTQTRLLALDFFVLFSSTAAIWGAAGQSSYAAANNFLDALAHARRAQGLPSLSINWGGWSEIGMAARDEVTERMAVHGVASITPDSGVLALDQAMRQQVPQLAVLPIDWTKFLARFPADDVPVLLSEMSGAAQRPNGSGQPDSRGSELLRHLGATVPANRPRVLAAYLSDQAKLLLGLDQASPVDPRRPLTELGLDSLMAIEMRNKLGVALGHTLSPTILFDYPTIGDLADYLASEVLSIPPDAEKEGGEAARKAVALMRNESEQHAREADVMQLSEDEVEASLAQELDAVQTLLDRGES